MRKYSYSQVERSFHKTEPWANVFIFKYITLPAVYFLVNWTNISPNQITVMSGMFGLLSGIFYSFSNLTVGLLLYLVSYIFDAIDGKIARITNRGSSAGPWIDICVDHLVFISVSIGIGIGVAQNSPSWLMPGIALMIGLFLLGFESRYNIQFHEISILIKMGNYQELSRYRPAAAVVNKVSHRDGVLGKYLHWAYSKGVTSSPVTLVELLIFLFCIAPISGSYPVAVLVMIFFLLIRLLIQQRFWFKENKI